MCILAGLSHPNVVRLLEAFATTTELGIVLPLASEALSDYVTRKKTTGGVPLEDARFVALQLARGIAYIQSRDVLHGDYKPGNVLIYDEPGCELRVVITDFGIARTGRCTERSEGQPVFSLWWRPPEVLLGGPYVFAGDVWAYGCIVAELLGSANLFQGEHDVSMLYLIFNRLGLPTESSWPGVTALPQWDPATWKEYGKAEYSDKKPLPTSGRPALLRYTRTLAGGAKAAMGAPEVAFLNSLLVADPARRPSMKRVAESSDWLAYARQRVAAVPCQAELESARHPEGDPDERVRGIEDPLLSPVCELLLHAREASQPTASIGGALAPSGRAPTYGWIFSVATEAKLLDRTIGLAVYIIERYNTIKPPQEHSSYAKRALVSLHIASALVDLYELRMDDCVRICDEVKLPATAEELAAIERDVLATVGIDLYVSTSYDLTRMYARRYLERTRDTARTVLLLAYASGLPDSAPPDRVALGCVLVAAGLSREKFLQRARVEREDGRDAIAELIEAFARGLAQIFEDESNLEQMLRVARRGAVSVLDLLLGTPALTFAVAPRVMQQLRERQRREVERQIKTMLSLK
jgi:serine/threonine protein kinase